MTKEQRGRLAYLTDKAPCSCATQECNHDCMSYLARTALESLNKMEQRFKIADEQASSVEKLIEGGELCGTCHYIVDEALR